MSDESKFDRVLDIIPYLAVHGLVGYCDTIREFVEWARKRDAAARELRDELECMVTAFEQSDNKYFVEDHGDPVPDAEAAIKRAEESEL